MTGRGIRKERKEENRGREEDQARYVLAGGRKEANGGRNEQEEVGLPAYREGWPRGESWFPMTGREHSPVVLVLVVYADTPC